MTRTVATAEHIAFAKANCLTMSENEIDKKFGTSKGVTKRILEKAGMRMPKELSHKLRAEKCKRIFTAEEIEYIKQNVEQKALKDIASHLKCGKKLVTETCHALGFEEILKKKEANSRFSKGHVPYYKGKRIPEEIKERIKHTYFQKGHLPHNTKKDGDISVRRNRQGVDHLYYRVKMSEWIPLKNKIWMDANGEIPTGHNIILKNGNSMDVRLDNLECISNKNLMLRNSIHSFPKEMVLQIHKIAKLRRIINKKIKKNEQTDL